MKINVKKLSAIGLIVLTIVLLAYVSYKEIKKINNEDITANYKIDFFNSIQCQFKCPLELQIVNNKTNRTDMVPDSDCLKNCSKAFSENETYKAIPKDDLKKDRFIEDMDLLVNNCRRTSAESGTKYLNTTNFFSCVEKNLPLIKGKYKYLD